MHQQIFVNLPTHDLPRAMAFWRALGYDFNRDYTDDKAACLVLGENLFAMLLVEPFFQGFTGKPVVDLGFMVQHGFEAPDGRIRERMVMRPPAA